MPSVTDDFQLPIMYQDLRASSMGMLPEFGMMYPGGMMPNTNYLGGMRMKQEAAADEFITGKPKKNTNAFVKVLAALGLLAGVAVLHNKGAFKWIVDKSKDCYNWVKNLFK